MRSSAASASPKEIAARAGHTSVATVLDRDAQAGVVFGMGIAHFRGDHDFFDQFPDQRSTLGRVGDAASLFPLCTHVSSLLLERAVAFKPAREKSVQTRSF
jgi:hypothetical protein